jgi:membrane protein implicated in regulation of membrane protease activity
MDSFLSTAVVWFIIGFLFFLLEFVVPGFILFFFGIGAWVVGILLLLFAPMSINAQLLIFLGTSVFTVLLFRNWVRGKLGMMRSQKISLEDEIIGKKAKAETAIIPGGRGKVSFRGITWDAFSPEGVEEGEEVLIIANESIILTVKSAKIL